MYRNPRGGQECSLPHFVPARIDSAFMGHQLLGPEDIGMTKCPMQRPGQWGRQTLIP